MPPKVNIKKLINKSLDKTRASPAGFKNPKSKLQAKPKKKTTSGARQGLKPEPDISVTGEAMQGFQPETPTSMDIPTKPRRIYKPNIKKIIKIIKI